MGPFRQRRLPGGAGRTLVAGCERRDHSSRGSADRGGKAAGAAFEKRPGGSVGSGP